MASIDEYGQQYERLPAWAPKPFYKSNGRPSLTMVQFLQHYHGDDQHTATGATGTPPTSTP